ncbi:MAG: hypothetical protein QOJ99_208 [Bryobacterales bacterium]|nr:hypothetical protein [Bryobacterales bacterium]
MAAADVRPDNNGKTETEPASEEATQFLLPEHGKEPAGVARKTTVRSPQERQPSEPSSKTTLRALQLASESEKALARAREQAASATGQLRAAEQQLLEEKKLRTAETGRLSTQIAGLSENLSAAARHTIILEAAGRQERRRMLGVCAVLIATALGLTALLVRTQGKTQPAPAASVSKQVVRKELTVDSGGSAEARALDRLMTAFSLLPQGSIPQMLRSANRLLSESGDQPCSVESASGEPALLFGPAGSKQQPGVGPLAGMLSRCAEAVERTLDMEHKQAGEKAGVTKK